MAVRNNGVLDVKENDDSESTQSFVSVGKPEKEGTSKLDKMREMIEGSDS